MQFIVIIGGACDGRLLFMSFMMIFYVLLGKETKSRIFKTERKAS